MQTFFRLQNVSSTFICTEGVEDAQRSQLLSCPRRETTTSCGEIMYSPPHPPRQQQRGNMDGLLRRKLIASLVSSAFFCRHLSPVSLWSLNHYIIFLFVSPLDKLLHCRHEAKQLNQPINSNTKKSRIILNSVIKKVSADRDSHQHYTKKAENVKQHAKIACGDWRTVTWSYSSSLWPLGGSKGQRAGKSTR